MISHGMDFGPYTRLAEVLRDRMAGGRGPGAHRPATFVDGVAKMAVLDAVRRSAREGRTVEVEAP